MDQSLEDIIRAKKSARGRGGRGRGGRGRGGRGAVGAGGRGGGNFKSPTSTRGRGGAGAGAGAGFKKFRRQPTEQVQDKWQHDMFQTPRRGARGGAGGGVGGGRGGGPKLMISNLDYGVSTDDIKELFTEFGRVVKAEVHYDKSGRSLGTATVVYTRVQDAQKAVNQYNNVPLDGRPMTVQIITGAPQQDVFNGGGAVLGAKQRVGQKQFVGQKQQSAGGEVRGRGRGRGSGRGGGGRGRGRGAKPVPTLQELDADLDAYKQSESMES